LKKINKIDKPLANLTKRKGKRPKLIKSETEKRRLQHAPRKSRKSSDYFENLYSNKLENLD
jgi:hypothetical protein